MSDSLTGKIEETRDELSRLLRMPLLDDVMIYMFISNLHKGKVWANYQLLKDFFTELQNDPKEWATTAVREMINRIVIDRHVDHALTRVMCFSGFSYVCGVGNDYLYADKGEVVNILGRSFSRLGANVQADFVEISHRYDALLKKIGR